MAFDARTILWRLGVIAGLSLASVVALYALALGEPQVSVELYEDEARESSRTVRGVVDEVDFRAETVTLHTDRERLTVRFARMAERDLYDVLSTEASRLREQSRNDPRKRPEAAYAHLVTARLCIGRGSLRDAQRHLERAEELDESLGEQIAWERARLAELQADEILQSAREHKEKGSYDRARRLLDRLLRLYDETAVAGEAEALRAHIVELQERERQGRDSRRERRRNRGEDDPFQPVRERITQAESQRREGHEHAAQLRIGRAYNTWRAAIETIYSGRNSAWRLFERAVERDNQGLLDEAEIVELEQTIREIRLEIYKALLHHRLVHGSHAEVETYLERALDLAPTDRELLHLRVLHQSAKRWDQDGQPHDRPEEEEEEEEDELVDPNPREPDSPEPRGPQEDE